MADEALLRHDGHILMHAIGRAAVNRNHVRPAVRLAPDDAGRDEVELRRRLLVAEQRPEARIFRRVLARLEVLDAQLVDLVPQHLVLLVHRDDFPEVARDEVQLVADPRDGFLERRSNRRGRLAEHRRLKASLRRKKDDAEHAEKDEHERPCPPVVILVPAESCSHYCLNFFDVMTTRFRSSMFSRDLPVPSPTHERASSATSTGMPVSFERSLSRFVSRAPPPVIMMP